MEKKTMGSFLSALRRANGLTQQEVADRLSVSNRAVSRWERDEAAPDISLLPAIADLFEVTVDELLRGERQCERRRAPDTEPSSTSFEADAVGSPDPRALRGLRGLCRRERTRFVNLICVSLALTAMGYVLLLGIAYGFYRPTVAYAVLTLFCVGSVIVTFLSVTRMREVLLEQAAGEDTPRLPDGEIRALVGTFWQGAHLAALAPILALSVGSPLLLIHPRQTANGLLSGEFYAPMAVAILVLTGLAGWAVGRVLWRRDSARWAETLDYPPPDTTHSARPRVLRRLNLWQWGAGIVGFGGAEAVNLFFSLSARPSVIPRAGWFSLNHTLTVLLLAVGLFGVVLPPVCICRRISRGERRERVHVLISGIRNLLAILGVAAVFLSGIAVVGQEHKVVMLIWAPGALVFFAMCVAMILLGAEVVRYRVAQE